MPLAGDQGAAIGFVAKDRGYFNFNTLKLGKRNMMQDIEKKLVPNSTVLSITTKSDFEDAVAKVARLVMNNKIVNIVTGAMEFGPRALCNTTSLFLPTNELVALNNTFNNRNEVMPCAPVIKEENGHLFFSKKELDRTLGSDYFMICTHDYTIPNVEQNMLSEKLTSIFIGNYGGVAHRKTNNPGVYTGRPQFVREGEFVWHVLDFIENKLNGPKALVNTSFNAHGRPIVFDTMDIIYNFNYQYDNAKRLEENVSTVGEVGKKLPYLIILDFK